MANTFTLSLPAEITPEPPNEAWELLQFVLAVLGGIVIGLCSQNIWSGL